MAIETAKEMLALSQIIAQKTETFLVEDDCIVPDSKPDILNVISQSGTVCIYKKEIMDGKIKIDGSISTYLMYLADTEENQVRSLNTNFDFSKVLEVDKAKSNMLLDLNVHLKSLDCQILNGRKIHLKAMVEADVKLFSNETVEYVSNIMNSKDIQCLSQEFQIQSFVGNGSTKVYAKDTLTIDQTDNLVEIMKADFRIINKETKISYNKVLVKSDLAVKLLYLTEDNRMKMVESNIPVMGFIDLPNISEQHICDVKYEMKNILVKPNNAEDHSIYVEVEIEVYCEAYENKKVNLIQDVYSPIRNLSFTPKKVMASQTQKSKQEVCNIREKQVIPEIGGNQIYDVEVLPTIERQTVFDGRIVYEGELNLNFIYEVSQGIDSKTVTVPFTFSMEFEGVTPTTILDTIVEITMQDFVILPDETIDMKIDLLFTTIMNENTNMVLIDNIEEGEKRENNSCSMLIYFVKPGDTLWKIAKQFGSTVEMIARVNHIEDANNLQVGTQLFIPRYHG